MQANEAQVNKFVKLLEQKKLKQARTYIAKIDTQDPDPIYQQIINKALFKCLVAKKSTPLGMVTSLYIYKEMLIKCLFDYLESQSFDQKIHKFLYETCQYNFTAPLEDRGNLYFKEKMSLQTNQQNQIYGNTIVTLSLEIVQAMANWYPIDYFSQKPSRYAQYYKKLTQNKVKFHKLQEHQFIKPDEKKKFNAGYDLFIKKMEVLEGDEDVQQEAKNDKNNHKQQTKPVNTLQPTPIINKDLGKNLQDNNTKKIDQGFIKPKADDIKSKIISENKKQSQNLKQKVQTSKIPIKNEQLNLEAIKQASPKKQQDIEDNKILNKRQIPKITVKGTDSGSQKLQMPNQGEKQKKYTQRQKMQTVMQLNLIKQKPKQPIKTVEQSIPKIEAGFIKQIVKQKPLVQKNDEAMFILQEKKQQKPAKIKEELKNIINNKNEQKQIKPQVTKPIQSKNKILQSPKKSPQKKTQQIKKNQTIKNLGNISQNLQIKNRVQRKHQQPIYKGDKQIKNQSIGIKEQNKKLQSHRIHDQKTNLINQIQNKYHNQKGIRRTQQNFYQRNQQIMKSRNIMTPKKNIERTQKKADQPQYVHGKHNSQPKTEKKASINTFDLNFARKNMNIGQNFKPIMNQTLSQLRNFKNKQKITDHTSETVYNQPILQLLDQNSIKADIIPFIPQYFLPVNNSMNLLLLESLKVGSNSQKSTPFLKNQKIEARLIKSQRFTYILSLYNKGYYQLQVIYSQQLHQEYANQHSSQIHIKGPKHSKNKQLTWIINPQEFLDIPFEFYINDPNFKFLDFVLKINNKVEILNLPITLLDQGFIQKYIDFQQISSFLRTHGKILKSSPVTLQYETFGADSINLPKIFNLNANKQSKLLGNLTYSIELRPKNLTKITIFVKKISHTKVQIYALFDSRNQQSEDFAKVLLQLFCFLLSGSKI